MITKHQAEIIERMKSDRLCREHTADGDSYFFAESGWKPNSLAVKSLRNMAIIAPADDGLFGDHQTYDLIFVPGVGVHET